MSIQANNLPEPLNEVDALFRDAEHSDAFWISKAKFHFTEEMLEQLESLGLKKADLASRLSVTAAQITRLCSGKNNFTISTMVRVARALGCEFCCHLQPDGVTTLWIDVLKTEPIRVQGWADHHRRFQEVPTEQNIFTSSKQGANYVSTCFSPAA